jgi:hypothetical protein
MLIRLCIATVFPYPDSAEHVGPLKNSTVQKLLFSKINAEGPLYLSLWELANPGRSREPLALDIENLAYSACLNVQREIDQIFFLVPLFDLSFGNIISDFSSSVPPAC